MKKKATAFLAGLSVLAAIFLAAGFRKGTEETVYFPDHLLRLHVVAHSDSTADQDLKRTVRDAIVREVAPEFLAAENLDEARGIARVNLGRIGDIASREIRAAGKDYPVKVELDSFAFPTKHYGPFVLPAGDYEAVRVVIGEGGGANWWCVLFPPLCFVDMTKNTEISHYEDNRSAGTVKPAEEVPDFGTPTTQVIAADNPAHACEGPEEKAIQVEYRFRILDFFKMLMS